MQNQSAVHNSVNVNKCLNQYIRKGFTLDDNRLLQFGGGDYWKELMRRIHNIRASEKVLYFAVHDQSAAEVIYTHQIPMTMKDWAKYLDKILTMSGEQLLQGNGTVSHEQTIEKATSEYKKYQQKTLSDVKMAFLDSIKEITDKTVDNSKEKK